MKNHPEDATEKEPESPAADASPPSESVPASIRFARFVAARVGSAISESRIAQALEDVLRDQRVE
jgi:hypothetical protein